MASSTAERVARNDATFRDANEAIEQAAEDAQFECIPFICECADPRCTEIVVLTPADYEAVRAESTRFLVTPGHETNDENHFRLVGDHGSYIVLEKTGEAAEVARKLDPRSGRPQ